jgi:hypothetical protein
MWCRRQTCRQGEGRRHACTTRIKSPNLSSRGPLAGRLARRDRDMFHGVPVRGDDISVDRSWFRGLFRHLATLFQLGDVLDGPPSIRRVGRSLSALPDIQCTAPTGVSCRSWSVREPRPCRVSEAGSEQRSPGGRRRVPREGNVPVGREPGSRKSRATCGARKG